MYESRRREAPAGGLDPDARQSQDRPAGLPHLWPAALSTFSPHQSSSQLEANSDHIYTRKASGYHFMEHENKDAQNRANEIKRTRERREAVAKRDNRGSFYLIGSLVVTLAFSNIDLS